MRKIRLPDVQFVLGIKKVNGKVAIVDSIPVFKSSDGTFSEIAPGFADEEAQNGDVFDLAYPVYSNDSHICKQIIKGVTVYEDKMADDQEDILTQFDAIYQQYENEKLRHVPKAIACGLACFILGALSVASILLKLIYPVIAVCAGLTILTFLAWHGYARMLDCQVVYDRNGNWVDFAKKTTSLMDGGKIPGME